VWLMSISLINKERFLPSRLSNLAVWLDAGDSTTVKVAQSTVNITQWNDKSGNGNDFFPDVLSRPPSFGPTYSNVLPLPYVSFTTGGGLKSVRDSGLTGSKTIMAVYNCPITSNSMSIQVGTNVSGGAFGLAQTSGMAYTPFQYGIGDLISTPVSYTGINYAFASFDASANNITGMVGFDSANLLASAFPNNISNTPLRIGDPSNIIYPANVFQIYELIATSNGISSSDRQEVEGYLANKWGLTLPSSHPYKNFQPSGDQWILTSFPTTVSGLVSWLDMTIPGQTETKITDSVEGLFSVYGSSTLALSNINNQPSLYFPGGNTALQRFANYPAVGSGLFVFTVSDTRTQLPIIAFSGNPLLMYNGGNQQLSIGNTGGNGVITDASPVYVTLKPGPNLVFFAWSNSNYYLSTNGGTPVVGSYARLSESDRFTVGMDYRRSTGEIPTMNFGELVVYSQYFEQAERQLLEGYLAWKWNIEGGLPAGHPYAKESPIGATVSETLPLNIPGQISSLVTWLDAADRGTFVVSGSSVSWYDKSATSDIFTRTTYDAPTYTITPGGAGASLPGVYFSGFSSLVGTLPANIANGIGSCFLVATVVGNAQVLMGGYQIGTPLNGNSFGFYSQGGNVYSPIQGAQNEYINSLGGLNPGTPHVFFAQMDAPSRIGQGSSQFSTPANEGTGKEKWQPSVPLSSPWNLGTTVESVGNPALAQTFYIHEFLCFSDYFTENQRQLIEGYLAWKWGLQSQLPRNHPYYGGRPQSA